MAVSPGGPVTKDEVRAFLNKYHPEIIDAIEAEAVAAERERIRAAVEGLDGIEVCICETWRSATAEEAEHVRRAAVLAIIDGAPDA